GLQGDGVEGIPEVHLVAGDTADLPHHPYGALGIDGGPGFRLAADAQYFQVQQILVFPVVEQFATGQEAADVLDAAAAAPAENEIAAVTLRLLRRDQYLEAAIG